MRSIIILLAIAISCLSIGITIGQHTASCYVVVPPISTSPQPISTDENSHKNKIPPCPLKMGTCDPIPL